MSEAAIATLFPRSNLTIFQERGSSCSSNRHVFPGGSICSSNRHVFPGGSIFSSNRHEFSRRVYRTYICFFKEKLYVHRTSNRPYHLIEQILIFPETLNFSNTYEFSRILYFLTKQISIFQEALPSHRTHIIFQETPMPRTDRHFPGRYPPSNRYFVIRSRWLFRHVKIY